MLWLAHAQSRLGDRLARVAIAVLVFARTSSALLTALTYALTFLPPLVSAPLLAGLADRYPRRTVLVTVDLCRAALVGLMVLPAEPLAVIAALLVVVVVSLQPPYSAARNAMLPNVLEGDRYLAGLGLVNATDGIVQVAGFAFGGVLLALVGSRAALGIDAATFVASALLARLGTGPHRPAGEPVGQPAEADPAPRPSTRGWSLRGGVTLVWATRGCTPSPCWCGCTVATLRRKPSRRPTPCSSGAGPPPSGWAQRSATTLSSSSSPRNLERLGISKRRRCS